MAIPWIIGGAVGLLLVRWGWLWLRRRDAERSFEYRITHRQDLYKYTGDNWS